MSDRRTAVVVGGSAGVGRALCDELAREGYDIVVSARDVEDLAAVAADLRLRHGANVTPLALDLCGPAEALDGYVDDCISALGEVDAVLIPAGAVSDLDDGTAPPDVTTVLVRTNFQSVATLAAAFVERFDVRGRGTIVLFSSIAVATPRGRNAAYGAAKAALEYYGRSLQHRFADGDVRVQIYALGYVDTAMAAGRTVLFPAASPQRIAARVVRGLDSDHRFTYLPRYWRSITFVLRRLPWPIYRRLRF